MIRPIAVLSMVEVDNNRSEITRISRFETIDPFDLDREKYLWLATAERDCHPLLYQRKMMCKRIESIVKTDHDSYQLLIHRDSETNTVVTLDCKTFGNIELNPEFDGTIIFTFEEYFTEDEQAELHKIFLSGEYDNIGDAPEF